MVHEDPVKSTSPTFSPSRFVSRWELSHWKPRAFLSFNVSVKKSSPLSVRLSPSVRFSKAV